MRVLALEPYNGGSHRAFLGGWSSTSRHDWTILGLPPHKWKWRMRHAAITFTEEVSSRTEAGESWDILFCSDMLNLAEFKGLVGAEVAQLPSICYFHENQLTYPVRVEDDRDLHFTMINLTTTLAADQVWFNSAFHRDSFLGALPDFLKRMPDHHCLQSIETIRMKAFVHPQGIERMPTRQSRTGGVPHILWVARWEHDKNPELFFDVLCELKDRELDFRLSVVGESFSKMPGIFQSARERLSDRICNWGYRKTRAEYETVLLDADIVVSTASHEFFGVGIVESIAAGAYPLLPERLAYPEILGLNEERDVSDFFYDGSMDDLIDKMEQLVLRAASRKLWGDDPNCATRAVERFHWDNLVPRLDQALEEAHSVERL